MSIRPMLFTVLLAVPVAGHPASGVAAPASNALPLLPISFEENRGQGDPHFHFLARMRGHTAAVAPGELWLRFPTDDGDARQIVLRILGADAAAPIQGIDPLRGRSNYFRAGHGPVSARQFRGLRYRELLPGVDWLVYARGAEVEHDYVVAPGVDAAAIEFEIEGAQASYIDSHGRLQIDAGPHTVALLAPVLYQDLDGRRVTVSGAFEHRAGDRYGFRVGHYDRSRELVIDPINRYATYLGGTGQDEAFDIAVDADGNAYVTGKTTGAFPTTTGAADETGSSGGDDDAFVAKLDADGANLLYATYLSGTADDVAFSIAVDQGGHAYVTGSTFSTDFPTQNALQNANAGNSDVFVTKLSADGASLLYSTYVGGSEDDRGDTDNDKPGIAVDVAGAAYIGGTTQSADFPTTAGVFDGTGPGPYAVKINPAGSGYAYATLLGSDAFAFVRDVAVYNGKLTVFGYTGNTDIPDTPGVVKPSKNPNGEDMFLIQVNADGTALGFATYFGGTDENDDFGEGIAIDSAGDLYLVGTTSSADYPITNGSPIAATPVPILSKLTADATAIVYSTKTSGVQPLAVAVDALGRASITGRESDNDVLFEQFDADGFGQFATAFSSGGGSNDVGNGIAIDQFGHAYLAGKVTRNNFPGEEVENTNPLQPNLSAAPDAFVMKVERDDPIMIPAPLFVSAVPGGLILLLAGLMLWCGYRMRRRVVAT